jgi:predicted RNase H-like HicB family nuclease
MMETKNTTRKPLDFYLNLQYPVTLYPDIDGGYTAEIEELRGCLTQGETADEALKNIEEARVLWIETAYEYGDTISLPRTENQYSGKVLLRMPISLHQRLAEGAEREGISLNQYILFLLSSESISRDIFAKLNEFEVNYSRTTGLVEMYNRAIEKAAKELEVPLAD